MKTLRKFLKAVLVTGLLASGAIAQEGPVYMNGTNVTVSPSSTVTGDLTLACLADGCAVKIKPEGADSVQYLENLFAPLVNSATDLGTAALRFEDVYGEKLLLGNEAVTEMDADVLTVTTAKPLLGVVGASATQSAAAFLQNLASAQGNVVDYLKTRAAAAASNANTIIVSGDDVYRARFWGANGATYDQLAEILVESAATPGASADMPGQLKILTTPDGSATPTLALTVGSDQVVTGAAGLTATAGNITATNGEIVASTSGKTLALQEATAGAACMGTLTCNGASDVVTSTTCATTGSRIFLQRSSADTDGVGQMYVKSISTGTSFTVNCVTASDTSTMNWIIFHEAA